jgi:alpha-beta hydrolase superfamily lysophospholipase
VDTRAAARLPGVGFYEFHPDRNINFQLNRFMAPGQEDLFAGIGRRISNFNGWKVEFISRAEEAEKQGDLRAASRFYRAAEFFISPKDPDRLRTYQKFIALFYQAEPQLEACRIAIPYASGRLHGLKLNAAGASQGVVLIHLGYDAYMEEFGDLARAVCAAGFDTVLFDGPGQGTTLMQERIPMTHAWEKPVAAVLDHLAISEAALIGVSLGGYLALRAAAFEPRIKRVAAYDVMLDFFQCITSRRGKLAEALLTTLTKLRAHPVLNLLARTMMTHDLYSRWGIEQGMHVMGCKTPAEFFSALRHYELRSISSKLTQDVLVMAGSEDHFVPVRQFHEQLRLLTNARSVTGRLFTRAESAQSHCQAGNLELATAEIVSWLSLRSRTAPSESAKSVH